MLKQLITNKYAVKDSFNLVTQIVDQGFRNFIGILEKDPRFTDIPQKSHISYLTISYTKN